MLCCWTHCQLTWLVLPFQHNDAFIEHPIIQSINLGIGLLCWVGLTAAVIIFSRSALQARRSGKAWFARLTLCPQFKPRGG